MFVTGSLLGKLQEGNGGGTSGDFSKGIFDNKCGE